MENGIHLTIDCFGADKDKCSSFEVIEKLLHDLPIMLSMQKICEPKVVDFKADTLEESGISGFVMIAESHISIHTYPEKNYFAMDVFSCKPFEHNIVLDHIKKIFLTDNFEINLVKRNVKVKSVPVTSN